MTDPIQQQIIGHLLGALDDDEQEWVESRLEHDEEYRRLWGEWRRRMKPLLALRPISIRHQGWPSERAALLAIAGRLRGRRRHDRER